MINLDGTHEMVNNRSDEIMVRKLQEPELWFILDLSTVYELIEQGLDNNFLTVTWKSERFKEVALARKQGEQDVK